ncbi:MULTISPECIES: serine/threonine-protein kinase [Myxococcus]|uniref:non-specific serine/threonine protein kinase n=1 Tax=Myxococcus xanthus TaxID=34 RepID=A0AAE6FWC0_MYXXA|nr:MULTISPECIES: serine/threonine-protein kinase [Myxococcus]QDE66196.1 serine/threonine protein kinase [Myxococcus xanthus]QDE73469.1 serine/threonine protein kinase [Myxococcus xanthus]QDE80738.1 serine/threonine protein kinase [Myxococcus xanthus]WAM27273.1 serine/threonine-protein kinase [Myxococcus sp. NMCA1]
MASELICDTCGLAVPADTTVCPRDGTVVLSSFDVPPREEPNVVVQASEPPPPAAVQRDPLIGLKLGEYELRSRIGVGGMGLVYEGIQPLIGKRVAVKVLRPELAHSTEQVERLLAEARAVNAIRHRGIIDIFGFGQVPDGRQYIVMEYLEGQALDAVLTEKNRLPVQEALALLDEVLAALAAAHGAGVVHRDLKPSNIFLVQQPDGSRYVKVLDFGLAKRGQGPTGRTAQTRTDMVVGTPEYMAPEQARGQEVGPMTDLYALGVVTFEIVTGRLPFVGSSPVDLLMKHVEARPPRPSEFVSDLPPALDAFILQMLTKDPETRPNSADALRQQLHKLRRTLRASTRSNPSALAPGFEKSAAAAEADARRPTTPVPVPPELNTELTSQELRAAGVRGPLRKHLPLVGAVSFAVLLLAGAAAVVIRGAKAPALVPPSITPQQAAAPEQAAAVTPPPAEPEQAPVEEVPLQPLVAAAVAPAPPDGVERPPPAPRAEDTRVAPPRPLKASAPTLEDILQSIDRLERRVDRLETSGKIDAPKANAARNLLAKYRDDARADTSAHARIDLLKKVTGVAGMIR